MGNPDDLDEKLSGDPDAKGERYILRVFFGPRSFHYYRDEVVLDICGPQLDVRDKRNKGIIGRFFGAWAHDMIAESELKDTEEGKD